MQELSGSVGEGGANAVHDTALIQALLVKSKRPAQLDPHQSPYLEAIDGQCGRATIAALRAFQNDRVFGNATGRMSQAVPGATAGAVRPRDVTWSKLIAAPPKEFSDLRVLQGSKTVYVAAADSDRQGRVTALNRMTFQPAFRSKIVTLINRIHTQYGIAVGVCPKGDRRTFAVQFEIYTSPANAHKKITNAGPGESNHNFGQAADLGFEGLRWLKPNGDVVENETSWLHQLDPKQKAVGEALIFWDLLRKEGTQTGLYRGPVHDRPHLQAWSDVGVDMATRLAVLMSRVGKMKWSGARGRYQCDLGLGGRFVEVGSAAQIWNRQATITVESLTKARTPVTTPKAAHATGQTRAGTHQTPPVHVTPATVQEVTQMQSSLRADFVAADVSWQSWK